MTAGTRNATRNATRAAGLLALLALAGSGGCSSLSTVASTKTPPPTGMPIKVTAAWDNQVYLNPDMMHDGNRFPTLAGNMYLFGEDYRNITARGKVVVDLYDVTQNKTPVQLERWVYDPDTLQRMITRDPMGLWTYRLILPWNTYRQDIVRVELRAHFERDKMAPMYAEASQVTVAQPDHPQLLPGAEAPERAQMAQRNNPAPLGGPVVQQTGYQGVPPGMNPPAGAMQQPGVPTMQPSLNPPPAPGVGPSMVVRMPDLSAPRMQQPLVNPVPPGQGMQPTANPAPYGSGMQQPGMNQAPPQ